MRARHHEGALAWLGAATLACSTAGGGGEESISGTSGVTASSSTDTATDATGLSTTTNTTTTAGTTGATTGGPGSSGGTSGTAGTGGPKFDVGGADLGDTDTGPPEPTCKVVDNMDAVGMCETKAPPNAFEPDVQWTWTGPGLENSSTVTPLVANLTDDNDDGEIDLCDVPDIVVIVYSQQYSPAHMHVLDGETGNLHYTVAEDLRFNITPAIGDIDDDGLPEIVAASSTDRLTVFEHDGTLKFQAATVIPAADGHSIALADIDNDGDVEIILAGSVSDHLGNLVWTAADIPGNWGASAAADLDGDGDLEVVLGRSAYHPDGTQYYMQAGVEAGFPQIANLDGDAQPEVLVNNRQGITVLEHDGAIKFQDLTPTGDAPSGLNWLRPSTVHDFDGDQLSEFAVSSGGNYSAYEPDATLVWSAPIVDNTGIAAGTAFDFLGDGIAEAMYADETQLFVFDGAGTPLLTNPRTSVTWSEYPVVADVDNDGSAEIVVVSNTGFGNAAQENPPWKTVQVIRDVMDRWIQARRIWNQHTYHVTNVREDGTIPQFEPPSWESLNTYRTNAQIEGGSVCKPEPEG